MSGMFGQVTPIAAPDFGQTMARVQGMQANRLAMLAQQRQMDEGDQRQQFFAQNAAGFASPDEGKRMNLLAMLAQQPGGAGMALPMLDQERRRAELRAIMSDGMPSPAAGAAGMVQPAASGGGYLDTLVRDESGGDPTARNPRSSATGAAQFIDSTWLQFAQANPERFRGMSREQILAARNDPNLSREAADWYRRENLTALSGQGLPANDGTAALAHRFGPSDAARLLRADPNAPIASVVSEGVMRANPDLAGRSVGQVVGRYAQRFGGGGDTIPASSGPNDATPAGNDQRIAVLQRRAEALMRGGFQQEAQNTLALIASMRRGESARPVEIADPSSPTGRRLVSPQDATGQAAPAPERNAQYVDLGPDAPQGQGRYERRPDGTLTRVGAIPPREAAAIDPFGRANTLRDEFTRLTGDFRTVQTAYQNIQSAASSQTGAGDMAMLYSFVKLLDPTSVVRESEFATAAASGSLGERMQGAVQRILSGERLPDTLRDSFLSEARSLYANNRRSYDRHVTNYRGIAERNQLNPDDIITPFDDDPGTPQPAAPGAAVVRPQSAGPGGQGTAEPPPGLPPGAVIRRVNPRTGRIE